MTNQSIAQEHFPTLKVMFEKCEDKEAFLVEVEKLATFFVPLSQLESIRAKRWARGAIEEKVGV